MGGGNSYNGWPANSDPNAIGIDTQFGKRVGAPPFGSGGYAGGMKSGDVSTLFVYLINRLHNEVEPMMNQSGGNGYGCWGYSYRANVNNPSQLSCHASGTAIDYNAPKHPNGTSTGPSGGGGWSGSQYNKIQEILKACSGAIRWLTSNDPMHFEIYGSASAVANAAAKVSGSTPPSPGPGPDPTPPPEEEDDDVYRTFQPTEGPDASGIWIGVPGCFDVLPSMEYYNILVGKGLAKPVLILSHREFDVVKDSYRRWPATYGEAVEIHRIIDVYHNSESAALSDVQNKVTAMPDSVWDNHFEATPGGGNASTGDILAGIYQEVVDARS